MNPKPQAVNATGADARARGSHRLRVALLLGTGLLSTTAVFAALEPKTPPYRGD
jgi:hypothetical protein